MSGTSDRWAPPRRGYGGEGALVPSEPEWRAPPTGSEPRVQLLALRSRIYDWIEDYYDRDHLTRAGDWMLVLAPDAPDHLVIAALLHDMERSVPGGPVLDMATVPWDDRGYNDAHTSRSAEIVPGWLLDRGVASEIAHAVAQPIREHEFGGSAEGDLMQAADSISYLETNAELTAGWANAGRCTVDKARQKLLWMGDRVRHGPGREIALAYQRRSLEVFDKLVDQEATR